MRATRIAAGGGGHAWYQPVPQHVVQLCILALHLAAELWGCRVGYPACTCDSKTENNSDECIQSTIQELDPSRQQSTGHVSVQVFM